MSREVKVRFCERRGVRFPPPTHRVLAISGTRADAEALREEIAEDLSGMGLRLSPEKTLITHIDEGLDFLGWRIQRHRKRVTSNTTSTSIRPRRRCTPSWPRTRPCAGRTRTCRSKSCCNDS